MADTYTIRAYDVATLIMAYNALCEVLEDKDVSEDVMDDLQVVQPKFKVLLQELDTKAKAPHITPTRKSDVI